MAIRYMIMRSNGDVWNRENETWESNSMLKNPIDQISYETEGEARIQQQEFEKRGIECLVSKTISWG